MTTRADTTFAADQIAERTRAERKAARVTFVARREPGGIVAFDGRRRTGDTIATATFLISEAVTAALVPGLDPLADAVAWARECFALGPMGAREAIHGAWDDLVRDERTVAEYTPEEREKVAAISAFIDATFALFAAYPMIREDEPGWAPPPPAGVATPRILRAGYDRMIDVSGFALAEVAVFRAARVEMRPTGHVVIAWPDSTRATPFGRLVVDVIERRERGR